MGWPPALDCTPPSPSAVSSTRLVTPLHVATVRAAAELHLMLPRCTSSAHTHTVLSRPWPSIAPRAGYALFGSATDGVVLKDLTARFVATLVPRALARAMVYGVALSYTLCLLANFVLKVRRTAAAWLDWPTGIGFRGMPCLRCLRCCGVARAPPYCWPAASVSSVARACLRACLPACLPACQPTPRPSALPLPCCPCLASYRCGRYAMCCASCCWACPRTTFRLAPFMAPPCCWWRRPMPSLSWSPPST